MNELYLYDRDEGLFKQILKKSKVIAGRYHVSPSYGNDLNSDNLDSFIKDEKYGLKAPDQKYPLCVCMPPKSTADMDEFGFHKEGFVFELFFICQHGQTGQNNSKMLDKPTGKSGHHPWYDWKDMKEVGMEFMKMLRKVIKKHNLRARVIIDYESIVIRRFTRAGNDMVSGASLSFLATLQQGECETPDYADGAIDEITVPQAIIHPHHKH